MQVNLNLLQKVGEEERLIEGTLLFDKTVSHHGESPCVITFLSDNLGSHQFTSIDIFGCLCELRKFLDLRGIKLLCNGARIDAYPSAMSRSMGGGMRLYILKIGQEPSFRDLVNIFDAAEPEQIGTVDEQSAYHERWVASISSKH